MIATHNIKVNGRWIHAGEEYEPETVVTEMPAEKPAEESVVQEAEIPVEKEEPKTEAKPKTPSRRKAVSK